MDEESEIENYYSSERDGYRPISIPTEDEVNFHPDGWMITGENNIKNTPTKIENLDGLIEKPNKYGELLIHEIFEYNVINLRDTGNKRNNR